MGVMWELRRKLKPAGGSILSVQIALWVETTKAVETQRDYCAACIAASTANFITPQF